MASILVVVFLVEVAVAFVNSIGAETINNLLWNIYTSTPIGSSQAIREHKEQQKNYLKVRRDLQATSSQDEFARWAKLRRQHDKMLEQLEKMKLGLDGSRAKFDKYVSTTRWVSTRGMKWFLPFWYSREPMFWLPHGWFPYYAEWLISFPRAPMGSVSVVSWQLGCAAVISLISDTIGAIVRLVLDAQQKETPQKQPMRASSPVSGEKKPSVGEGKKFS